MIIINRLKNNVVDKHDNKHVVDKNDNNNVVDNIIIDFIDSNDIINIDVINNETFIIDII